MTKEDFLIELRKALSGSVSADVINDNLNFYENFINTEIRKGRTESEVLEELGNPRLLAKTVIDTADRSEKRTVEEENEPDDRIMGSRSDIMPWWMILVIIFGIMIAIYLAINVAAVLLPVILGIIVIGFIIKIIRKLLN